MQSTPATAGLPGSDPVRFGGSTWDVYVLCPRRSRDTVTAFLDRFMPDRVLNMDEYTIPPFSLHPRVRFEGVDDLIAYLAQHPHEDEYYISWSNTGGDGPEFAIASFSDDGGLIMGLIPFAAD